MQGRCYRTETYKVHYVHRFPIIVTNTKSPLGRLYQPFTVDKSNNNTFTFQLALLEHKVEEIAYCRQGRYLHTNEPHEPHEYEDRNEQ